MPVARIRRTIACVVVGTWIVGTAGAQPAPTAIESFLSICDQDLSHAATGEAFESDGWQAAPTDYNHLYTQDLIEPDVGMQYFMPLEVGAVLAASYSEKRGLLGTRTKTVCMVRIFTNAPERMRTAFRVRMSTEPDEITDSDEVQADVWRKILKGRIVGFRGIKRNDGNWMITLVRVLNNA